MKKDITFVYKVCLALAFALGFSISAHAGGLSDAWRKWVESIVGTDHGAVVVAHSTGNGKVYVSDSPDDPDIGANDSGGVQTTTRGSQDVTFTLKAFPDDGYKFDGWKSTESSYYIVSTNNPYLLTVETAFFSGNATQTDRYAYFSLKNYYITYDVSGGTLNGAVTQTYTIKSTDALRTATRDNYSFNGWKVTEVDPSEGNWTINEIAASTLNKKFGDVTLTALWTPLLADITINVSGLDSSDSAIYTISSGGTVLYTVVVPGSSPSVTVKDLPTGVSYDVNPKAEWNSWEYDGTNATETFALGASGHTSSFTYTKKSSVRKHDEKSNTNWKPQTP